MAKLEGTKLMAGASDGCLQLSGDCGFMREYRVARAQAENRYARLAGGSSEVVEEIVACSLSG